MKNPFSVRLAPDFIPYKNNDLYRGFAVWRGHEYTVIRSEDLEPGDGLCAGDFGISSDTWVFAIRDSKHVATCQVHSGALNGRLLHSIEEIRATVARIYTTGKKGPQELRGAIDFCTSYPTSEDSVRNGSVGVDCSFQVGETHFQGESSILRGDPIVLALDTLFMSGPPAWWTAGEDVVAENLLAFNDIWERLEEWFLVQRNDSLKAASELPKQCSHCRGAGTVPR